MTKQHIETAVEKRVTGMTGYIDSEKKGGEEE